MRFMVPVKAVVNSGKPFPKGTLRRVTFVNGPGWTLKNVLRVMREPNWDGAGFST